MMGVGGNLVMKLRPSGSSEELRHSESVSEGKAATTKQYWDSWNGYLARLGAG